MNKNNEESPVNKSGHFGFESHAHYKAILQAIPDLMFVFDSSGTYLEFFTNETSQLASPPDNIIGKKIFDFFPEHQSKIFIELFNKALETGEVQATEYEMVIDSKTKSFETRIVPFEQNKLLTFVRDITPIRRGDLVREATHKISEAVSSSHSLEDLFSIIHRETSTVLTANNFYIALYDKKEDMLSFPYFVDEVDSPPEGREKPGKGLTEYVLRTGKSLLATPEIFNKLVAAGEAEIVGEPSIDWLGVPLVTDNVTFGVMVVQTYTEGIRYTQEDKEYLEVIASQAATSIKRKKAEEEQFYLNNLLFSIAKAQEILLTEKDFDVAIHKSLSIIGSATKSDRAYIFENFFDEKEKKLLTSQKFEWCNDLTPPQINNPDLQNISYIDFMPRWYEELSNDKIITGLIKNFPDSEQQILNPQRIISILVVPIFMKGIFWGFIGFDDCRHERIWSETEIAILSSLADTFGNLALRRQKEEELRLSQATYLGIINSVSEAIYLQDEEGRFLEVNRAAEKIYGFERDYFIGKTPEFLSAPGMNNLSAVAEAIKKTLNGEPQMFQFWGVKKDGTVFPKDVSLSPGTFFGKKAIIAVARDITERKHAEDNLRKSEERYRLLADNIGDVIFTLDLDLNFKYISPSIKVLTGYAPEEIIKKHFSELLTEHSYRNVEIAIKEEFHKHYLAAEGVIIPNRIIELEIIKKNNVITWVEVKSSFLRDEGGKIFGILGVARDITLRKHAEQEIIQAKEKAEEMNRLKTNFLSNMSHELRTPLVAILGSAEILTQELTEPSLKKWAQNIFISGKRLLETQNLILDLSKIEAEKIEVVYSIISMADTIKEVVSLFTPLAQKKGLKLNLDLVEKDINARLDERLVREVLNNLVNNAIKYTEKGGIVVKMTREDNSAVISVKDTGIGIPREKMPIIFEEFRQVSEGRNRSFEGTGLGLTITKRFVELLRGTMAVDSKLGEGTEFIVKLPIGKIGSKTTVKPSEDKTSLHTVRPKKVIDHIRKILLVEDDSINANLIFYYLKAHYNVTIVSGGLDAIKKASEDNFDIILMDINLGRGMNGLEATRRIRSTPGYKKTPVVAITAFAMQGDKEEFLQHGCTHYISKPFEKNVLLQLLSRIEAEISG